MATWAAWLTALSLVAAGIAIGAHLHDDAQRDHAVGTLRSQVRVLLTVGYSEHPEYWKVLAGVEDGQ